MRIQLWSCQYDPEPLGIGPISGVWARELSARGHHVEVVAAHPHYPKPEWGTRLLPYREKRDGIKVIRLPQIVGRTSKSQRLTQELSFVAAQSISSPFLGGADVLVSVSPSFPALLPALVNARLRRTPWIIWLQDILPDGAASTGYLDKQSRTYRLSRRLEDEAYNAAYRIMVLSDSFRKNLIDKGVPENKIALAYNPATFEVKSTYLKGRNPDDPPRIICMGNIGKSQGLPAIAKAFESNERLTQMGAELIIVGAGVAEPELRHAIQTDRVKMLGLIPQAELERELARADLGVVSQSYDGGEFNVPSKLMNYLAIGLPVVASVSPRGEVASIVHNSGAGWVTDQLNTNTFADSVADALATPTERNKRSIAGVAFAREQLSPSALATKFESLIAQID